MTLIKKGKQAAAVMLLSLGMMLPSGCSDAATGSDSLLRPPRPTGDKAAIQEIIASEAGGSYTLKYPQKGENRSAITLRNEDTEKEFALALYATENDTRLNVSIIACRKKEWRCLGTYTNTGSGVDRVMFYDVNGDKNEEIIIGWTSFNTSRKTLTAYSLQGDETFEMNIDETYDELIVSDLTNNQRDDILLLSLSTPESPSYATLLQYSERASPREKAL